VMRGLSTPDRLTLRVLAPPCPSPARDRIATSVSYVASRAGTPLGMSRLWRLRTSCAALRTPGRRGICDGRSMALHLSQKEKRHGRRRTARAEDEGVRDRARPEDADRREVGRG